MRPFFSVVVILSLAVLAAGFTAPVTASKSSCSLHASNKRGDDADKAAAADRKAANAKRYAQQACDFKLIAYRQVQHTQFAKHMY
jgi:hypothetical protein